MHAAAPMRESTVFEGNVAGDMQGMADADDASLTSAAIAHAFDWVAVGAALGRPPAACRANGVPGAIAGILEWRECSRTRGLRSSLML